MNDDIRKLIEDLRRGNYEDPDEKIGQVEALRPRVQSLAEHKSQLLVRTHQPGFYQDITLRNTTFDELHKLEEFLALDEQLCRTFDGLNARLAGPPIPSTQEAALAEQVDSLAAQLEWVSQVAQAEDARDLGDACVEILLVERKGSGQSGVEQLARMYLGFAALRRLSAEVLAERFDDSVDSAIIQVTGLGAYALLKTETGLHRLHHRSRETDTRSGREKTRDDRETVRVNVLPLASEPDKAFLAALSAGVTRLHPVRSRLIEKAGLAVKTFHKPSLRALELWTNGDQSAARDKFARILFSQISAPASPAEAPIIRQYELGIGSRVKDYRTGRTTARVAHVFKGHLEFLA